jgi:hypothetical protein
MLKFILDSTNQLSYSPIRSPGCCPIFCCSSAGEYDDAGEDFPLLEASRYDVPSCTIPLPHEIPVPHASRPPSHKRDHARSIDVRSEVFRSRRAGEIRQDDWPRTYGLTHSYTWHVATMERHIKKG